MLIRPRKPRQGNRLGQVRHYRPHFSDRETRATGRKRTRPRRTPTHKELDVRTHRRSRDPLFDLTNRQLRHGILGTPQIQVCYIERKLPTYRGAKTLDGSWPMLVRRRTIRPTGRPTTNLHQTNSLPNRTRPRRRKHRLALSTPRTRNLGSIEQSGPRIKHTAAFIRRNGDGGMRCTITWHGVA